MLLALLRYCVVHCATATCYLKFKFMRRFIPFIPAFYCSIPAFYTFNIEGLHAKLRPLTYWP